MTTMKLRSTLRPVTQRDLDDATLKPAVCEMGAYVGRHRHNPKSDQKPIFGRREPSALKFRFPSGFNAPTSGTLAREQALQLCHRLCMVLRNVEIAIMGRLEHGN